MPYPTDLKYTKEHEWIKVDGKVATVGITDYAQESLGDIVFVDLPKPGSEITAGKTFGTVESVKAVSDLYAPASGTVSEVKYEGLLAQVTINVGGQSVTSIITRDACDALGLKKGVRAFALIKSTEVMVIRG